MARPFIVMPGSTEPINVARLARTHRVCHRVVWPACIAVWMVVTAIVGVRDDPSLGAMAGMLAAAAVFSVLAPFTSAWLLHRMNTSPGVVAMWMLPMLVPVLNLTVWLTINHRAETLLWRSRLAVGVLGAASRHIDRLRTGVCFNCGYDLAGLRGGVCPECGSTIDRTEDAAVTGAEQP